MNMELKRCINNRTCIYAILSCFLAFILGYFLLITIDHRTVISLNDLYYSVYTVYSQFGFLIFPVIVSYVFSIDYKDKNILFYKMMGIKLVQFYLYKIAVLIISFTVGTLSALLCVAFIYNDFTNIIFVSMKYLSVLIYIILMSSLFAFLFKNILGSFCVNLLVWILGIVSSTIHPTFEYFCYYDASIERHKLFDEMLHNNTLNFKFICSDLGYDIIIFAIVILLINIFSKRWVKNGI